MLDWMRERFELARGGGSQNVRPMEGLRGFAVFLVFLVHYVTLVKPWIAENSGLEVLANSLHIIGNTGVDLFFVLSGYLIYGSLITRPQSFIRFMARRVERIYPAFITVFGIYVILSFAFPLESKIPRSPLEALIYLLQNLLLLPGLFPIQPVITVAWSLSYEMLYYLVIPLVILLFGLRNQSPVWRTGFFLAAAASIAAYTVLFGGHVRLIMFISGILLHEAMRSSRVPNPGGSLACMVLALGLLGTLLPLSGTVGVALKICVLFAAFFVLCLACFRDPWGWLSRAFSWTPLRWLGNMSYSYYLLHGLALKGAFLALPVVLPAGNYSPWVFWSLLPAMFAATLVASAALFIAVERPFSLVPHQGVSKKSGMLSDQRV